MELTLQDVLAAAEDFNAAARAVKDDYEDLNETLRKLIKELD